MEDEDSRRWGKTFGERRSPAELRKKYEAQDRLGRIRTSKAKEKRDKSITQKFRLGAKVVCTEHIWKVIELCKGVAECDVAIRAEAFGLEGTQVQEHEAGGASFHNVIAFMTDLGMACENFDPLPSVETRAIRGYQLAIALLDGHKKPKKSDLIDEKSLRMILAIRNSQKYREARAQRRSLLLSDWVAVAEELAAHSNDDAKSAEAGERLQEIMKRWAKLALEVQHAIPHRWVQGDDQC